MLKVVRKEVIIFSMKDTIAPISFSVLIQLFFFPDAEV